MSVHDIAKSIFGVNIVLLECIFWDKHVCCFHHWRKRSHNKNHLWRNETFLDRKNKYCIFQKAEPESEEEEDEVVIYRLNEQTSMLDPIEDEHLLDEVFAEFCHQYERSQDADEAMELDR